MYISHILNSYLFLFPRAQIIKMTETLCMLQAHVQTTEFSFHEKAKLFILFYLKGYYYPLVLLPI